MSKKVYPDSDLSTYLEIIDLFAILFTVTVVIQVVSRRKEVILIQRKMIQKVLRRVPMRRKMRTKLAQPPA